MGEEGLRREESHCKREQRNGIVFGEESKVNKVLVNSAFIFIGSNLAER